MPTILRDGPHRFFFTSHDRGEPPHVHVRTENKLAKFWLDPLSLADSGRYSRSELNQVAAIVERHREAFLERWYEFFGR